MFVSAGWLNGSLVLNVCVCWMVEWYLGLQASTSPIYSHVDEWTMTYSHRQEQIGLMHVKNLKYICT